MERTREERLKARMLEDGVDEDAAHLGEEEDVWGGSDEEVCHPPSFSLTFLTTFEKKHYSARPAPKRTNVTNSPATPLLLQPCTTGDEGARELWRG